MFKKIALAITVLWSTQVFSAPQLTPAFKEVELKEFTSLQLQILPDAGTQLIFPFQLDNPDLIPSLKVRLTNANGFLVPTDQKEIEVLLKGQNTLSILGKANPAAPGAVYLGNLFITIGGYNLSIGLRTTFNTTEHISNIIFKIDDKTREHMVESAVKRKTKALDKEYKEKFAKLDELAKEMSLTHISKVVTKDQTTTNFKEDVRFKIGQESLVGYADKLVNFGGEYHVLIFELTNKNSSDFTVDSLTLYGLDGEDERKIQGVFDCNPRLNADETIKCAFASISEDMKNAKRLKLSINTDRGEGAFQW